MTQALSSDSKVMQVKNQLIAELRSGKHEVGGRLPSTRKIAMEYGVSSVTASLALAELKAMGLVESRKGSGTFVSESFRSSEDAALLGTEITRVGLVVNDTLERYSSGGLGANPSIEQQVEGVRDFYADRDCLVKVIPYSLGSFGEEGTLLSRAVKNKVLDGLLVTGHISPDELNWLLGQAVPFVLVDCGLEYHDSVSRNLLAGVHLSMLSGVRILFSHLAGDGYSDCVFLTYTCDNLAESIASTKIKPNRNSSWDFHVSEVVQIPNEHGMPSREVYREYVKKTLELSPRLVVVRDEVIANHLLWQARELDLRIPDDIAVASLLDMTPENHPMSLTALGTCAAVKEVAYQAASILDQGISGSNDNNGTKVLVMPTLNIGESS